MYVNGAKDIDYSALKSENNIDGLIFDIDNTLAPFDAPEPDETAAEFFARLKSMGFAICLLSNNSRGRVTRFNSALGLHAVFKAGKPGRRGVSDALAMMGTSAAGTALIGDQVFTDVLCGNRCGLFTILVKPVSGRDEFAVRLKRYPERLVLNAYARSLNMRNLNTKELE
jgi:HAD superfamily phosphatase (TIGR01668 family)